MLTRKQHILEPRTLLKSKINTLKAINGVNWDADRYTILILYSNMIRHKLAYGCILFLNTAFSNVKLIIPDQNKCLKLTTEAVKGLFTYYVIFLWKLQMELCGQRPLQFVVAGGHNIYEVTGLHFRGIRAPKVTCAPRAQYSLSHI